ncbi:MAG TPA: hypothetical protein VF244_06145 [Acidimicrobiales bacterium]
MKGRREKLEELVRRQEALYHQGSWREAADLDSARLDLEREVARDEGRPFAEALDWRPRWSGGAPLPHLLTNGLRTFLTYYVQEVDPTWDGTWTKVRDPSNGDPEPVAVATFERCIAASLGPPNDEVLHGHPLHGSGLGGYDAHIVRSSRWIADLMAMNSVHEHFSQESWSASNHYLLVFHDEVFECVAERYDIETITAPLPEILVDLAGRLNR